MKTIRRKENEGFESFMRRFNRAVQENRILTLAKKRQFFEKPLTKRERRESAIRKRIIREIRRKKQMGLIK